MSFSSICYIFHALCLEYVKMLIFLSYDWKLKKIHIFLYIFYVVTGKRLKFQDFTIPVVWKPWKLIWTSNFMISYF